MSELNLNMPTLGPATLPSGPPDAALWTVDAEKQINALIYILCIIKFDLFFFLTSAKQLKRESQSIIHQAKSAPQQTNEMILGGLASALGMVTHPIYSVVRETLGYVIAFRWGINLPKTSLNNRWVENYILLQV